MLPFHYIFKLSKNLISARFVEAEILADVFSEDDMTVTVLLRLPKTISRIFKRGRDGFTIFYHEQTKSAKLVKGSQIFQDEKIVIKN